MTRATKSKVKGGRATRRRHTEEFKREALGLAEKIGVSEAESTRQGEGQLNGEIDDDRLGEQG